MSKHSDDAPDCAGRNGAPDHGKHTPGPWVIDPCWDILGNTDDGNGMVCQITTDAVPRAEAEANARLIAAAPDMLEALKQAEQQIDYGQIDAAHRIIIAAIDKAEGRS